jgi:hypothetical protein
MEQDLLEYAVAAAKLLPDDLRNELSKLQLFSKFEAHRHTRHYLITSHLAILYVFLLLCAKQ